MITDKGAAFGGVEEWQEGIITRGVLLDVPKHRGEAFVTFEKPVHGWELDDIAKDEGVTVGPGDAVIVYSGRDAYARDRGGTLSGRRALGFTPLVCRSSATMMLP